MGGYLLWQRIARPPLPWRDGCDPYPRDDMGNFSDAADESARAASNAGFAWCRQQQGQLATNRGAATCVYASIPTTQWWGLPGPHQQQSSDIA
jgi:hypothetical protein